MPEIKIIHVPKKDEPFVVLEKPAGMASAPLSQGETDCALFEAIKLFPEIKNVRGKKSAESGANIEFGLLHRLDTATQGLMLIATSQEFYDHIILSQKSGGFVKTYLAECDCDKENAKKLGGFPELSQEIFTDGQTISSYFRAYGKGRKEVRPVLENSSQFAIKKIGAKKLYSTKIVFENDTGFEGGAKITCKISQGFRHQVRCHLAWLGFPVIGDALYNATFRNQRAASNSPSLEQMHFFATGLEFTDCYGKRFGFSRQ